MLNAFARQSNADPISLGYSGERTLNYFLRPVEGVSNGILAGRSGTEVVATLPGPVRALVTMGGELYAIAGGGGWRITNASVTNVGSVPDDRQTYVATSRNKIAIVAGANYHICNGQITNRYDTGAVERRSA